MAVGAVIEHKNFRHRLPHGTKRHSSGCQPALQLGIHLFRRLKRDHVPAFGNDRQPCAGNGGRNFLVLRGRAPAIVRAAQNQHRTGDLGQKRPQIAPVQRGVNLAGKRRGVASHHIASIAFTNAASDGCADAAWAEASGGPRPSCRHARPAPPASGGARSLSDPTGCTPVLSSARRSTRLGRAAHDFQGHASAHRMSGQARSAAAPAPMPPPPSPRRNRARGIPGQ